MVKKLKETKIEPSIFRAMIEKFPYKQITIDFPSKEEALEYVHALTNENTAWYGLYELNPAVDSLIYIEHRRLRPYNDTIPEISKDNTKKRKERHRRSQ
jgi:hypothetical protein